MSSEMLTVPVSEQYVVIPDYVANGVPDVDFEALHANGQSHLLLDLDQTSRRPYARHVDPVVASCIRSQIELGFIDTVSIVSDSETDLSGPASELDAQLFQPFTSSSGELIKKPDIRFYQRVLDARGITADQAVMVGDRYLLDVVGAGQADITTVLVDPLGGEFITDRINKMRKIDRRALSAARTIVAAQTLAPTLSGDALDKAVQFDLNLEKAKPYLFGLADQLLDAYPSKEWDVLIGEHTSGELITQFVRHVLLEQGIKIPTAYVCTSYSTMRALPRESYEKLADRIAGSETSPRHPLVVSENTSTGNAMRFIGSVLGSRFDTVDFALGASRFERAVRGHSGDVYTGGIGREPAEAMFGAFEEVEAGNLRSIVALRVKDLLPRPARSRIRRLTNSASRPSYPFSGVVSPDLSGYSEAELAGVLPVAELPQDKRYTALSIYSRRRMQALAAEYTEQIGD